MITELNIDVTTLEVLRLPIDAITPHPLNPRPFSQKYKAKVYEEKVEELIVSIRDKGYDIRESIVVRTYEGSYQIVAGHHRWIAARECGMKLIPAFVEEISDEEAAMSLINRQGKEVEPWCEAEHAYVCCNEGYGRNGSMTQERYAELRGKKRNTISYAIAAFQVKKALPESVTMVTNFSVRAARDIASLDETDWAWFGKLCLDKEWGEKDRQAAIKAVKSIDIPPYLQHWLDPQKYKVKAAAEATVDGESRTTGDVRLWTNTVQEYLESQNPEKQLSKERPTWKFKENGTPYQEVVDVQGMFLAELFNIENPSKKKIDGLAKKILDRLDEFDKAYKTWEDQQKSKGEQQQQREEAARRLAALQIEYAPTGFNADIRELTFPESAFDAVITDPPYLLSSGGFTVRSGKQVVVDKNFEDTAGISVAPPEWVPIVAHCLKPGGYLVVTCTDHLLFQLHVASVAAGLELRQTLAWHKPNAPPLLSADRFQPDFEHIYIATKPGATPRFGYDELKEAYPNKQFGAVIEISQCGGKERLGWHDTQKPLELAKLLTIAYVPKDGLVLDPFAGTATFTVAAKQLGRKATWVEKDPDFYVKAESRIEQSSFHWE